MKQRDIAAAIPRRLLIGFAGFAIAQRLAVADQADAPAALERQNVVRLSICFRYRFRPDLEPPGR